MNTSPTIVDVVVRRVIVREPWSQHTRSTVYVVRFESLVDTWAPPIEEALAAILGRMARPAFRGARPFKSPGVSFEDFKRYVVELLVDEGGYTAAHAHKEVRRYVAEVRKDWRNGATARQTDVTIYHYTER